MREKREGGGGQSNRERKGEISNDCTSLVIHNLTDIFQYDLFKLSKV